jgi:hypothetical protein
VYVARVGLSGIKGFAGVRTVDLPLPTGGGWTVLAGRNGSGKTTLLQALALALSGPSVARNLVPDFSGWITAGTRTGWAHAEVTRDPSYDTLFGRGRAPKGSVVLGLEWTLPVRSKAERAEPLRPSMEPYDAQYGYQSPERGPWAGNPQGWFCAGYGPFRRLVGGSGEAQRLMLAPGPVGRMATLFHEDASLAEGVSWLVDLHLRRLERRAGAAATLRTVTALLSDGLLPDGYRVAKVDSNGLWVRRGPRMRSFPLREMSDGYRTVAALVLDVVRQIQAAYGELPAITAEGRVEITAPGVVLIDEIDAHLHVTWQRRIGDWLRQHFPKIQFIVTSHSPYICQAADPGGLIRMPGPDEDRAPEVVDEDLYHRVVYGSGDDAALSELFGLETPYSTRAERQRRRLVELERKALAGRADEAETQEYQELAERLTSSLETRVTEVAARLSGGDGGR